jgi:hypothetical protein
MGFLQVRVERYVRGQKDAQSEKDRFRKGTVVTVKSDQRSRVIPS